MGKFNCKNIDNSEIMIINAKISQLLQQRALISLLISFDSIDIPLSFQLLQLFHLS